ncbi:protein of unknown function [Moritella yayanosii]|uniref:Uncharacterized protein n=1 Tax=Moritella yayanosii TaxID=69539 RepID=A0A330LKL9_9GAMM|nr:protein of unknown function [Moritella yayanosii]
MRQGSLPLSLVFYSSQIPSLILFIILEMNFYTFITSITSVCCLSSKAISPDKQTSVSIWCNLN